jgi:hypothetical protein
VKTQFQGFTEWLGLGASVTDLRFELMRPRLAEWP